MRAGLSLRELARRLGLTASAVSQFETGKSKPSVGTLFEIVELLGVSLDDMLKSPHFPEPPAAIPGPASGDDSSPDRLVEIERQVDHSVINLGRGVQWEQLGRQAANAEFLLVTYNPGSSSSTNGSLTRHKGREFGYMISGELDVNIGSAVYKVRQGDSITFPASAPHQLRNAGTEPAKVMWCIFALDQ